MEPKHNEAEDNAWVNDKLARLTPKADWHPDSHRALARLEGQQPQKSGAGRSVMALVILVLAAAVVVLLPWQSFWIPSAKVSQASPEATNEPADGPLLTPAGQLGAPAVRLPEVPPAPSPRIPVVAPAPEPQMPSPTNASTLQDQGVTEPRLHSRVAAKYTEEAREARVQGTVELLCLIREDGTLEVREITKSLGYGLDESAAQAVSQWRFEPGKKDGRPVPVFISIQVNFTLR